ncbi:MAG: hypothetical protein QOC84_1083, partial [Bradyrhizobium sp.]|nr:hypothetical protein [Bradyrhizobium sp.]
MTSSRERFSLVVARGGEAYSGRMSKQSEPDRDATAVEAVPDCP